MRAGADDTRSRPNIQSKLRARQSLPGLDADAELIPCHGAWHFLSGNTVPVPKTLKRLNLRHFIKRNVQRGRRMSPHSTLKFRHMRRCHVRFERLKAQPFFGYSQPIGVV